MDAIRCSELSKRYERGRVLALDRLDLDVEEGSIFGFLGPNGAGKSTAIKILTGLIVPTSGDAWVAGEPVTRSSLHLRSQIGYLSQNPHFYSWMTGRELLIFAAELFGIGRDVATRRANELLEVSGLARSGGRRIGGYSGGMIQRLGIAQALASAPRVLFLDEPCASLDPLGRRDVLAFILDLRGKTTVLLSTHILEDVERVCDTVGIIDRGRMAVSAPIADLVRRFAQPVLDLEFETPAAAEEFRRLWSARPGSSPAAGAAGRVLLTAETLGPVRTAALRLVAEHALPLARLNPRSASLEEVFVRLVGRPS